MSPFDRGKSPLTSKLARNDPRNITLHDLTKVTGQGDSLSWHNIGISAKEGGKQILQGLSGIVRAGEMVAIMGPSGCGKTTLLNVLAGRTGCMSSFNRYTGKVALNGVPVDSTVRKQSIAYVMQEDIFYPELSVMETFMFAARLKMPFEDRAELEEKVLALISDLELTETVNTRIGNELIKGISGGQQKRLSIGLELIVNPLLIFLDEPTSGLDSTSAKRVCTILQGLAQQHHCIVLATIHQPSAGIFALFTTAYLLRSGRCVFCESVDHKLHKVWADLKDPIPAAANPADYCLASLQAKDDSEFDGMVRFCNQRNEETFNKIRTQMEQALIILSGNDIADRFERFVHLNFENPILIQLHELCRRTIRRRTRARGPLLSLMITPVITLFIQGLLAHGVGKSDDPFELYSVWALIVAMMLLITFNTNNSVGLEIPAETPIRRREIQSNLYTPKFYMLSKCFVDLPFLGILFTLGFLPCFFLIPFNGPFHYLLLAIIGHSWVSISVAWCVSVFVTDESAALQYLGAVSNPQLLFLGLLVKVKQIPKYLRWANYLCFMKYSVNIFSIFEFPESANGRGLEYEAQSENFLENQFVVSEYLWMYIMIQSSIFLLCVLISIGVLQKRNSGEAGDHGIDIGEMGAYLSGDIEDSDDVPIIRETGERPHGSTLLRTNSVTSHVLDKLETKTDGGEEMWVQFIEVKKMQDRKRFS